MTELDELPAHRQDALLWLYALELDYDGVDDLVRDSVDAACPRRTGPRCSAPGIAVLGDDGRYHLLVDGRPSCARPGRRGTAASTTESGIVHEQRCFWWTDGGRYRLHPPASAWQAGTVRVGKDATRAVTWQVVLTEVELDPTLVPVRARCPIDAHSAWPGYLGTGSAVGAQRRRLVAEFGPWCAGCGRRRGSFVDHDHVTGLIRGLLCVHCNTWIDRCPHLTGCPWAQYLNHPPAAHLGMRYARAEPSRRAAGDRQRIAYRGFDLSSVTRSVTVP